MMSRDQLPFAFGMKGGPDMTHRQPAWMRHFDEQLFRLIAGRADASMTVHARLLPSFGVSLGVRSERASLRFYAPTS